MSTTTNEYEYHTMTFKTEAYYAMACYWLIQTYKGQEVPEQLKKKYIQYRIKGEITEKVIKELYMSMVLHPNENKEGIDIIKRMKKEIKLGLIKEPCVKIYRPSSGYETTNFGELFDYGYSCKSKAICIYYDQTRKDLINVYQEEYKELMGEFKRFIKDHNMIVSSEDVERKGKKLYAICFGKENHTMCDFSLSCFSLMIDGFAYYFFNKENRDKIVTYLNK
jgi:hypothetical protein